MRGGGTERGAPADTGGDDPGVIGTSIGFLEIIFSLLAIMLKIKVYRYTLYTLRTLNLACIYFRTFATRTLVIPAFFQ